MVVVVGVIETVIVTVIVMAGDLTGNEVETETESDSMIVTVIVPVVTETEAIEAKEDVASGCQMWAMRRTSPRWDPPIELQQCAS